MSEDLSRPTVRIAVVWRGNSDLRPRFWTLEREKSLSRVKVSTLGSDCRGVVSGAEPARAKDRPCRRPPCPLPARRLHRARRGRARRPRRTEALFGTWIYCGVMVGAGLLPAAGRPGPARAGGLGADRRRPADLDRRGNLLRGRPRGVGLGTDPLPRRRRLPALLSAHLRRTDRAAARADRQLPLHPLARRADRRARRRRADRRARPRADRRRLAPAARASKSRPTSPTRSPT